MEKTNKNFSEFWKALSKALSELKKTGKKRIVDRATEIETSLNKKKNQVNDNKLGISFGKNGKKI